jgi:hypothetical protein
MSRYFVSLGPPHTLLLVSEERRGVCPHVPPRQVWAPSRTAMVSLAKQPDRTPGPGACRGLPGSRGQHARVCPLAVYCEATLPVGASLAALCLSALR